MDNSPTVEEQRKMTISLIKSRKKMEKETCSVCSLAKPCPCGGDRHKYAEAIARSFMDDMKPMDDR
jgi:hypothetical protein